jgi:hypothetical protein
MEALVTVKLGETELTAAYWYCSPAKLGGRKSWISWATTWFRGSAEAVVVEIQTFVPRSVNSGKEPAVFHFRLIGRYLRPQALLKRPWVPISRIRCRNHA